MAELLLVTGVASSPASERSALLLLRSSVSGEICQWNTSDDHCRWRGVTCDGTGTVIRLALPGNGLAGVIPRGVLGNLTSLAYLSFRQNSLASPLPADLSLCRNLGQLRLFNNTFTGPFPSEVLSLTSLSVVNLSGKAFSGAIPAGLGVLSGLSTLYLNQNNFSGQLPDLDLPALSNFNVSFNRLNGSVPAGLRRFPASAFLGTFLCGVPATLTACPAELGDRNVKHSGWEIAGIVTACVVVLLVAVMVVLWLFLRRGRKAVVVGVDPVPVPEKTGELGGRGWLSVGAAGRFELKELLRASA